MGFVLQRKIHASKQGFSKVAVVAWSWIWIQCVKNVILNNNLCYVFLMLNERQKMHKNDVMFMVYYLHNMTISWLDYFRCQALILQWVLIYHQWSDVEWHSTENHTLLVQRNIPKVFVREIDVILTTGLWSSRHSRCPTMIIYFENISRIYVSSNGNGGLKHAESSSSGLSCSYCCLLSCPA